MTRWTFLVPVVGAITGLAGSSPTPPRGDVAITRAGHAPVLAISARAGGSVAALDAVAAEAPPRTPRPLALSRNGWAYDCMECHTLLTAKWRYDRVVNEHTDIELRHGNNRYCLNCHHATNRDAFADYDGSEIAPAAIVQLCAKCHGTIFRDWQAGVHGRQNGYWKMAAGPRTKLQCNQCHDPHQPLFPAMKPLAPLRYPPRAANAPAARHPLVAGEHRP